MPRWYEYRHVVTFDDTNVVGNVYFTQYLHWQGRCRELFLREHAPEILQNLDDGMLLVTTHCSATFLAELRAFDEVVVRMRLADLRQNRVRLQFEYLRQDQGGAVLVAGGEQEVACMRRHGEQLEPVHLPKTLRQALDPYAVTNLEQAS